MTNIIINKDDYYTTAEVLNIFKIDSQTLYRWRKSGKIKSVHISSRKIMYEKESVNKLLGIKSTKEKNKRKNVLYCRVSSTKQKDDLEKQKQILSDFCNANGYIIDEIYSEIASGMNEDRIEFNKLIDSVINEEIENIYITYKDRLTRFGYKYFENLFDKFGTKIIVLNNTINQESFEQELSSDLISIIHHFSMKMYSNRRKHLKQVEKILNE